MNYSELQTALNSWAIRSESAADLQTLIELAEGKFKRNIRHREMEAEADITADAQSESLPAGFIAVRHIYIDGSPKKALTYTPKGNLFGIWAGSTSGKPDVYSISGGNILFGPSPDASYTVKLGYYEWDALSDSNTSNWLLASYPDVYLQAALAEMYRFVQDPEKAAYYDTLVMVAIDELNTASLDDEIGSAPIEIRSEYQ